MRNQQNTLSTIPSESNLVYTDSLIFYKYHVIMYSMVHKTYQHRVYTSREGNRRIHDTLNMLCELYNAALLDRKQQYRYLGNSVSYEDQGKQFTMIRQDDKRWQNISTWVGRGCLRKIDRAFDAFYRRVKAGENPGYPRFKKPYQYNTIDVPVAASGMLRFRNNRWIIKLKGLSTLQFSKNVTLPDIERLKNFSITRRGRKLFANLTYDVDVEHLPETSAMTGIDVGINKRLTFDNGKVVDRRQSKFRGKIEVKHKELSRTQTGSIRHKKRKREIANLYHKERISNRNACHRLTSQIVQEYGFIATEKLNLQNMTKSAKGTVENPGKNVKQKAGFNKAMLEQTVGMIIQQILYKAEWAGRKVVQVDPKYTSQDCSRCGHRDKNARVGNEYTCVKCGYFIDADVNAARNILARALAGGACSGDAVPAVA